MRIANSIEMLEVPANNMGKAGMVYPTLLWEDDTVILVDAGFPGQLHEIRAAMKKTGVPIERLTHVILTHQDIDHIGGVSCILTELAGLVCVMAHVDEKDYIDGTKRLLKLAQLEANLDALPAEAKMVYEKLSGAFQSSRVDVDQTLAHGEVLPYCGGIEVIHTPGHTLGHICLYHQESKTLIAGDALAVEAGKLSMAPAHTNFDAELCKASLQKLTQLDIQTVICYHGGVFQESVGECISALANGIPVS